MAETKLPELFEDEVEKSSLRDWIQYLKSAEGGINEGDVKYAKDCIVYVRQVMQKFLKE